MVALYSLIKSNKTNRNDDWNRSVGSFVCFKSFREKVFPCMSQAMIDSSLARIAKHRGRLGSSGYARPTETSMSSVSLHGPRCVMHRAPPGTTLDHSQKAEKGGVAPQMRLLHLSLVVRGTVRFFSFCLYFNVAFVHALTSRQVA